MKLKIKIRIAYSTLRANIVGLSMDSAIQFQFSIVICICFFFPFLFDSSLSLAVSSVSIPDFNGHNPLYIFQSFLLLFRTGVN